MSEEKRIAIFMVAYFVMLTGCICFCMYIADMVEGRWYELPVYVLLMLAGLGVMRLMPKNN